MPLENICVSLETAKKLAESFEIKSCFYWVKKRPEGITTFTEYYLADEVYEDLHCEVYPAPTSEEIERYITRDYEECEMKLHSHYSDRKVMIECFKMPHYHKSRWYSNKTEALAEMLLWLTENGYLKG